jgi:16S rRNA (adenine1518-N6/adenine1519-N6)-dimethyltransferase
MGINMHVQRKRFGQHFLCDQEIIKRIIASLAPKSTDHLIEIGPGQGALTVPILKQINDLEVIEIDRDLIHTLQTRAKHSAGLCIYSADVLDFDFATLKKDGRPLRIFGNLPYNISTPLIFHLLNYANIIADMLFMLQKEVAHRLAAKADSSDYGRLSVMVQYHFRVELLFDVPSSAFYPPPQVQSSMVRLVPYSEYPYKAHNYSLFASIVKHAFGQRRKTLRNSLRDIVDDEIWTHIQIHSDLRAENLQLKDFVEISNALSLSHRPSE